MFTKPPGFKYDWKIGIHLYSSNSKNCQSELRSQAAALQLVPTYFINRMDETSIQHREPLTSSPAFQTQPN